jgi:hypothetical protein
LSCSSDNRIRNFIPRVSKRKCPCLPEEKAQLSYRYQVCQLSDSSTGVFYPKKSDPGWWPSRQRHQQQRPTSIMNAAFEALFVQHAMSSYAKQLALLDAVGEAGAWSVNLGQGTLTLDDIVYQVGLLGSYNKQDHLWLWCWANPSMNSLPMHVHHLWLWCWANPSMNSLPMHVTAVAKQMHVLCELSAIPLLNDATTPALDEYDCHRLAMVIVGLPPGCRAYYCGLYGGGAAFFLIQQPIPVDLSVIHLQRVVMECVTHFCFPDGTHHDCVTSFFWSVLLTIERSEPTIIITNGKDGTVQITLDEHGRVFKGNSIPLPGGRPL